MTAGNATPMNDGAAALLIATEERPQRARPRAAGALRGRRRGRASSRRYMGPGPSPPAGSSSRAPGRNADIDLAELNEAFAAQALPSLRELASSPPSST